MIKSFALGAFFIAMIIAGASFYWHNRQEELLITKIPVDPVSNKNAADMLRKMGFEGQIVVGISVFDVFYNCLKINNSFVLRGIEHLHHSQNFENFGQLISFMKESILYNADEEKLIRISDKYKGYTGEEVVFDTLRASGKNMEVPESGTWPGADVYVDGNPINIKITDNPAYISSHFREYPDIPVYTNTEMKSAFFENPKVTIDPDLSSQNMFDITHDSLNSMVDMGELIDQIPLITLAVTSLKNTKDVWCGKKDIITAGEHIVCDTAAAGIGGALGAKVGVAIGLALVPATGGVSAIVVPAVSTLIGSLLGILSGKSIVNWYKERHLRAAIAHLKCSASQYCEKFKSSAGIIIQKLLIPYDARVELCNNELAKGRPWIVRTLFPSVKEKFYNMSIDNLENEKKNINNYYQELRKLILTKEPDEAGLILYAQGVGVFAEDKTLLKYYQSVEQALKKVEREKEKLT